MRTAILLSVAVLVLGDLVASANTNADATISVDTKHKIAAENGDVLVPITMEGFSNVCAVRIVIGYEGGLENASFEPADYLNAPLMLPIDLDRANRTIDISITGTGRVVTRSESGVLGFLRTSPGSRITSCEIKHAEVINAEYRKEILVDGSEQQKSEESAQKAEVEIRAIKNTRLFQNVPNPSNPTTTISFDLKQQSPVRLEIYSVTGKHIKTLINRTLEMNHYEIEWDGQNHRGIPVSSGVYFYRFQAGSYIETKKLIILK